MTAPVDLKALADRYATVTGGLSSRAGQLMERLDRAEKRGHTAMDAQNAELDKMEKYISQVEDFTNQISNGGPALDDKPKIIPLGVTLNPDAPPDNVGGVVLNKDHAQ